MGVINYGTQLISYPFGMAARTELANQRNFNIIMKGIYWGGELTKINNTTVQIAPLNCFIEDSTNKIGIRNQTTTPENIAISTSTPFIVLRFSWINSINNYMDMLAVAEGSIQPDDLILGKAEFEGIVMDTIFDYTRKSIASTQIIEDKKTYFRAKPTEPESNQVYVDGGVFLETDNELTVVSGLSPVISATTDGRIDLVYIDIDGSIKVQEGIDAVSPTKPTYEGKMVIAEIVRGAGKTIVKGNEITQIKDNRVNLKWIVDFLNDLGSTSTGKGADLIKIPGGITPDTVGEFIRDLTSSDVSKGGDMVGFNYVPGEYPENTTLAEAVRLNRQVALSVKGENADKIYLNSKAIAELASRQKASEYAPPGSTDIINDPLFTDSQLNKADLIGDNNVNSKHIDNWFRKTVNGSIEKGILTPEKIGYKTEVKEWKNVNLFIFSTHSNYHGLEWNSDARVYYHIVYGPTPATDNRLIVTDENFNILGVYKVSNMGRIFKVGYRNDGTKYIYIGDIVGTIRIVRCLIGDDGLPDPTALSASDTIDDPSANVFPTLGAWGTPAEENIPYGFFYENGVGLWVLTYNSGNYSGLGKYKIRLITDANWTADNASSSLDYDHNIVDYTNNASGANTTYEVAIDLKSIKKVGNIWYFTSSGLGKIMGYTRSGGFSSPTLEDKKTYNCCQYQVEASIYDMAFKDGLLVTRAIASFNHYFRYWDNAYEDELETVDVLGGRILSTYKAEAINYAAFKGTTPTSQNQADAAIIWDEDDQIYKMWWMHYNSITTREIAYAESYDGKIWFRKTSTNIVGTGVTTDPDSVIVGGTIFAIKEGSTYKLLYNGYATSPSTLSYIVYRDSSDGITWSNKVGIIVENTEGVYDTTSIGDVSVIKEAGYYRIFYTGYVSTTGRVLYCEKYNLNDNSSTFKTSPIRSFPASDHASPLAIKLGDDDFLILTNDYLTSTIYEWRAKTSDLLAYVTYNRNLVSKTPMTDYGSPSTTGFGGIKSLIKLQQSENLYLALYSVSISSVWQIWSIKIKINSNKINNIDNLLQADDVHIAKYYERYFSEEEYIAKGSPIPPEKMLIIGYYNGGLDIFDVTGDIPVLWRRAPICFTSYYGVFKRELSATYVRDMTMCNDTIFIGGNPYIYYGDLYNDKAGMFYISGLITYDKKLSELWGYSSVTAISAQVNDQFTLGGDSNVIFFIDSKFDPDGRGGLGEIYLFVGAQGGTSQGVRYIKWNSKQTYIAHTTIVSSDGKILDNWKAVYVQYSTSSGSIYVVSDIRLVFGTDYLTAIKTISITGLLYASRLSVAPIYNDFGEIVDYFCAIAYLGQVHADNPTAPAGTSNVVGLYINNFELTSSYIYNYPKTSFNKYIDVLLKDDKLISSLFSVSTGSNLNDNYNVIISYIKELKAYYHPYLADWSANLYQSHSIPGGSVNYQPCLIPKINKYVSFFESLNSLTNYKNGLWLDTATAITFHKANYRQDAEIQSIEYPFNYPIKEIALSKDINLPEYSISSEEDYTYNTVFTDGNDKTWSALYGINRISIASTTQGYGIGTITGVDAISVLMEVHDKGGIAKITLSTSGEADKITYFDCYHVYNRYNYYDSSGYPLTYDNMIAGSLRPQLFPVPFSNLDPTKTYTVKVEHTGTYNPNSLGVTEAYPIGFGGYKFVTKYFGEIVDYVEAWDGTQWHHFDNDGSFNFMTGEAGYVYLILETAFSGDDVTTEYDTTYSASDIYKVLKNPGAGWFEMNPLLEWTHSDRVKDDPITVTFTNPSVSGTSYRIQYYVQAYKLRFGITMSQHASYNNPDEETFIQNMQRYLIPVID